MIVGYGRISTSDQRFLRQEDALRENGAEKVFLDVRSGKNADRPQLKAMFDMLRAGDTVLVLELSRLGRSVKDLIDISERLDSMGVSLKSLSEAIDTTTPMGRAFFTVCATMAQLERELIVERTREGLAAARARGRVGGRPGMPKEQLDAAVRLYQAGSKISEIKGITGVSSSVLYRTLEDRGIPRRVDQYKSN